MLYDDSVALSVLSASRSKLFWQLRCSRTRLTVVFFVKGDNDGGLSPSQKSQLGVNTALIFPTCALPS